MSQSVFMGKIDRIFLYKIIAGASFLLLSFMQLLHIRTMYNLENTRYNSEEKQNLKIAYEKSIVNDKLFPGGQKVVDHFIYRNYDKLAVLWQRDKPAYHLFAKTICDSLLKELRNKNTLDSLLPSILKKNNVTTKHSYALFLQSLDIAFLPSQYAPFYDRYTDSDPSAKTKEQKMGALLGGTLTNINGTNLISGLIVSSPTVPSYRIGFALHGESTDRLWQITLRLLPTILISIFSIIAVLLIFLFTLINWQRQRKVSEMKSDFINTITHEFQTPLTAIIIANKTIENENNRLENPQLSSLSGVIKRQTERMNVLIKQVIESSQEHGFTLHMEPDRINLVIEEILADYQLNIKEKNIQLLFEPTTDNDKALIDKLHFTSVVLNILDNAVKYTHKAQKKIIITTASVNHKLLLLSIKDNGEGMSEKVRRNMFTRFYRDPSLTRTNEPGLGLGLYFTKQSLTAHGWKYEVKTKQDIGTEFLIYIPTIT